MYLADLLLIRNKGGGKGNPQANGKTPISNIPFTRVLAVEA
jgi:hypothetical protein